jgi:predicted nucleic acid-binding Zn ribbon protein
MESCRNCGAEVDEGASFCSYECERQFSEGDEADEPEEDEEF